MLRQTLQIVRAHIYGRSGDTLLLATPAQSSLCRRQVNALFNSTLAPSSTSSRQDSKPYTVSDPWDTTQRPVYDDPDMADSWTPLLPKLPRLESDGSPETRARKLARLIYQSRKRGILESDLICSLFADKHLDLLSNEQLDAYDSLLDENDWDIYYWAAGRKQVPDRIDKHIISLLADVANNESRKVLRMPDLKHVKE